MTAAEKPIGYWVKHLDRLIEITFDRSLAEQDLSRRHWQTMNTLWSGPADASGLSDTLRPFWSEGRHHARTGPWRPGTHAWIIPLDDGRYALTAER